ncbi:hypothetical protein F511_20033 [Dorcoceras hygrometricum]|uniref:Uncharacterized protein n=1 Tax=Dorcoceras hygrometricum TaxID=472368 RepID=A0A2Z7B1N4_9LAMI|nr:hypothetical protein F511_20033 [Dorcoceras hygrometricum]
MLNTLQVDFEFVLAMEHTSMARRFKSLEDTWLKGFMEASNSMYEGAVTNFLVNAKVIVGTIVSFVANRNIFTKYMFTAMFGFPTEGMIGFLDIPKETVVEMRRQIPGSDVSFRARSKKKEMKMEFRLLHDIVAKVLCAKAGSYDVVTIEKFDLTDKPSSNQDIMDIRLLEAELAKARKSINLFQARDGSARKAPRPEEQSDHEHEPQIPKLIVDEQVVVVNPIVEQVEDTKKEHLGSSGGQQEQSDPEVEDQLQNNPFGVQDLLAFISPCTVGESDRMRFYPDSNPSSSKIPTLSGSFPIPDEDHVYNLGPNPISDGNNTDQQGPSPSNLQMVVYNVHREENTRISYEEDVDSSPTGSQQVFVSSPPESLNADIKLEEVKKVVVSLDSKVVSLYSKVISLVLNVHSMNSRVVSLDSKVEELLNIQTFMKHDFNNYKRGFYDKMDMVAANVTSSQTSLETSLVRQLTEHQLQLASALDFVKLQLAELVNHLKETRDAKKGEG